MSIKSALRDVLSRLLAVSRPAIERQLAACQKAAESDPEFAERLVTLAVRAACRDRNEGGRLLAMSLGDGPLVSALRARSGVNDSLVYAHHVFAEVDSLARRHASQPRTVLEIGPGVNLGVLFCFVASGVQSAAAVDVEPLRDPGPAFYHDLCDYLACVEGFTWWRCFATAREYEHVSFPTCTARPSAVDILARIDYKSPATSDDLPFPDGSFDLVYSVAALEHVPRPEETAAEIARVLRPGGGFGARD